MGRNIPSTRKKLDDIVRDIRNFSKLIMDEKLKSALEKILEVWYREIGAVSNSGNPLLLFNLLLLNIAHHQALLEDILKRIQELERKIEEMNLD